MRKRSGGLHSDNYEQYLQVDAILIKLSQIAETKIGIFYDENQNTSNKNYHKKQKCHTKSQSKPVLTNFDFDRSAISTLQETKIIPKKISTIHLMIILEPNLQTEELIKSYFQIQSVPNDGEVRNKTTHNEGNRNVDLLIKNKQINENEQIVYKIWFNFAPYLPIFEVYYKFIENFIVIQNSVHSLNQKQIEQRILLYGQKKQMFYQYLPNQYSSEILNSLKRFYEKSKRRLQENLISINITRDQR